MEATIMDEELSAWQRARPVRVAFLVPLDEHSHITLDGVFADCYNRWGGRFSLVVPCENNKIPNEYWAWLEKYDADIIYSYVPLARVDVLEIHERLGPSHYTYHLENNARPRQDVSGARPKYPIDLLSSMSTVFRAARHGSTPWASGPLKVIDSWHTEAPSRYLTDNLGTYHVSRGGGIYPIDAKNAATLLTIVSPEKQADRRYGVPTTLDSVSDENAAFTAFAEGKATSLSILSSLRSSPRHEVTRHGWSGSFNLVIGDTVADRILFWNARLLIPGWLDSALCCWRVSPSQIADPELRPSIAKLISLRNNVNGGSGGQSQLTVRSTSHSAQELADALLQLRAAGLWGGASVHALTSLREVVPSNEELRNAAEGEWFSGKHRQTDWSKFLWVAPNARPPICQPDHLSDVPRRQAFSSGHWAVDYSIQLDDMSPRFGGTNTWRLPRRWRMSGAFRFERTGSGHQYVMDTRSNLNGELVTYVTADRPLTTIQVPTPEIAFSYALSSDGAWAKKDGEHGQARPANLVAWLQPSNEARYLDGVLGITGGLGSAVRFLLHPYLQAMFAKMGGVPTEDSQAAIPTINRLRKKARTSPTFELSDDDDVTALATLALRAARELKGRIGHLAYDQLHADWSSYRANYWQANPMHGDGDKSVDWDALELASLDECLISMRRQRMVFQGHQWTCERCHHKNWVDMAQLSPQLPCEVCQQKVDAPVNFKWLFRPSEFLIQSLRDHSALSLVWALSRIASRSRTSLLYRGPTWFGYDPDSIEYDSEADLLVVTDGESCICEVKSSWQFPKSDITSFINLATHLRPSRAIFAVMAPLGNHSRTFAKAGSALKDSGIEFELMTLEEHSMEDTPYLPS